MDKKIAALLAGVAGVATAGAAQAAPSVPVTSQPSSYADLLAPIANPVEALKADDAARAEAEAQLAQYYYRYPPDYYYGYPGTIIITTIIITTTTIITTMGFSLVRVVFGSGSGANRTRTSGVAWGLAA